MFRPIALTTLAFAAIAYGQQVGTLQTETHPRITVQQCSAGGSCTSQTKPVVLDSNWRWTHAVGGYTNCYTDNLWNTTACPDGRTCAQVCKVTSLSHHHSDSLSHRTVLSTALITRAHTVSPPAATRSASSSSPRISMARMSVLASTSWRTTTGTRCSTS